MVDVTVRMALTRPIVIKVSCLPAKSGCQFMRGHGLNPTSMLQLITLPAYVICGRHRGGGVGATPSKSPCCQIEGLLRRLIEYRLALLFYVVFVIASRWL